MKRDFSDLASFLKATSVLREATFVGVDLTHDESTRSVRLAVTRPDDSTARGRAGGFLSGRRPAYLRTELVIRQTVTYRQSLAHGPDEVYVFDRAEVGRGGSEISLYFRPGDRAIMDVEKIDGSVEDAGRATSAPRKPVIVNPILKQERDAAKGRSVVGRLLDKRGGKSGSGS